MQPTTDENGNAVGGGISLSAFIWTIVLNVSHDLFVLIGFCAVGYLIFGGYMYMLSRGRPEGVTKGKKIITNAIIGLIISILAVSIINFIVWIIGA
jgi:threonine/homoserine/homoserine lactone efflux protein